MAQSKFEFKVRELADFSDLEIFTHLQKLLQNRGGFYVEAVILNGFPWETVRVNRVFIESTQDSNARQFFEDKGYKLIVDILNKHFYRRSEIATAPSRGIEYA